jgi:hypothetical protein
MNMQNHQKPEAESYKRTDTVAQALTQRQHNFKMSYDTGNQMLDDKNATPHVTNVSSLVLICLAQ